MIRIILIHLFAKAFSLSFNTDQRIEANATSMTSRCRASAIYDSAIDACCSVCPAGQGVALPCTSNTNDTVCASCMEGATYSNTSSHDQACQHCSSCPRNAEVLHRCNITHNTKCRCLPGFFYSDEKQTPCKACSVCLVGQMLDVACTPWQDTVCKICPAPGCTTNKLLDYRSRYTQSKNSKELGIQSASPLYLNHRYDNNGLIAIYCAPFVLIFVSLLAYVVKKRWKLCEKTKLPSTAKTRIPPTSSFSQTFFLKLKGNNVNYKGDCSTRMQPETRRNNTKKALSDTQRETKPMLISLDSQMKNLSAKTLSHIEQMLTSDDVARIFSGLNNYARTDQLSDYRSKTSNGTASTNLVARQLAQNNRVKLRYLIESLSKISRTDVANIILDEIHSRSEDDLKRSTCFEQII